MVSDPFILRCSSRLGDVCQLHGMSNSFLRLGLTTNAACTVCVFHFINITTDCYFKLQKEEIKSCEERVKKLLVMTPPKGEKFLHSIEHILERERNWVCTPLCAP